MKPFIEEIVQKESDVKPAPRIVPKNYFLCLNNTRQYLKIAGYSSQRQKADKNAGKYTIHTIIVPKRPQPESDVVFVQVELTEHNHIQAISSSSSTEYDSDSGHSTASSTVNKKKSKYKEIIQFHQITGAERHLIAQDMLLHYGSSAEKYQNHLITQAETADETTNIASLEIYRKNTITKTIASTSHITISAEKVKGNFTIC